jgi:uncharacterized sulfatase
VLNKKMNKTCFFIGAMLIGLLDSCFLYAGDNFVGKPNIIIVLADDLGYGDIGAYGNKLIKTPSIDSLAQDGMTFTEAYASSNVCSPSRAGLLTGRFAIRSGLGWKVVGANDSHGLPGEEETIAELVQRAGYRTMMVGKWHLGNLAKYSPLEQGFDRFYGVPHSNDMPGFVLYENTKKIEQPVNQRTLTQRYTAQATRFINKNSDNPFLLFVSHTFPHIPLYASKEFEGKSAAGLYGDTVEELDWSTGEIIKTSRKKGILENTLIIFTSDNGPFFEGSSGGLKGGKGNSWEGGYRVPFIASWPDVIAKARGSSAMTMNIDLFATIADILDLSPKAEMIDGRSLLPLFEGDEQSPHDFLYYFNNENLVGLRSPDWKLVTHAYYTGSLGAFEEFDQLPGFEGSYNMLLKTSNPDGEAYSFADREPGILERLSRQLAKKRQEFDKLRTRPKEPTYPR